MMTGTTWSALIRPGVEEWRIICPCQRHGQGLLARNARRLGRKLRSLTAVALPLLLGVAAVPLEVLPIDPAEALPANPPANLAPLLFDAPTPEVMLSEHDPLEIMERLERAVTPTVANGFTPFTRRIRHDFLSGSDTIDTLTFEALRREYFRTFIPWGDVIYREAKRNGLPPELVAAVVKTESDFRPRLVSHKNAHGLMQIIPSTGELMGARDLMDPVDNIRAGTRYLRYLNKRFQGDRVMVLAAYNAGEGNVLRYGGVPPFRETQQYVRRVAAAHAQYQHAIESRVAAFAVSRGGLIAVR